jgi:hypothetical protein
MANPVRDAEVAEVDGFLKEQKRLQAGVVPIWLPAQRGYDATWTVEDQFGTARAQLRFTCRRSRNPSPTFVLLFRNRRVWLVEVEDPPRAHRNPTWVAPLHLPSIVSGPHAHTWPDNRTHVAQIHPDWDLPARRPLVGIATLPQALAAFASDINMTIDSNQTAFDVPPQQEMFP